MIRPNRFTFFCLALFFTAPLWSSAAAASGARAAVIEVFPNSWDPDASLGLVYNSDDDLLRYVHETGGGADAHKASIYDVQRALPHGMLTQISLTAQNNDNWKSELQDPTGIAYDHLANTYFIAEYQGDLSWHDDYVIEVNSQGTVLNAWEMDDECGSNGSSDGSEIDSIIDIAVIPGQTPRYFATASYDGAKVYEIRLVRGGGWWADDSWSTVQVYELPVPAGWDNLGIDWDYENERFYHSDWNSTTVLVTDINMEPIEGISRFDCPGAGGYNSGIAFIEGSDPPEVWVTDFTSNETTRCESPAGDPLPMPWIPMLLLDR
jgi:hypothetical protein